MNLWDQFLAWLGLAQPTADGTMSNVPQPLPGPTGPQGPQGVQGIPGPAGTSGSVWYNGSGAPSNALGNDGDYYLDNDSGNVYFKVSGLWS